MSRHPFLLFGVVTLVLFFVVRPASGLLAVLIVPMYLMWIFAAMVHATIAGPAGLPGVFGILVSGIGLTAGLAPYFLADYLWNRGRNRRS